MGASKSDPWVLIWGLLSPDLYCVQDPSKTYPKHFLSIECLKGLTSKSKEIFKSNILYIAYLPFERMGLTLLGANTWSILRQIGNNTSPLFAKCLLKAGTLLLDKMGNEVHRIRVPIQHKQFAKPMENAPNQ